METRSERSTSYDYLQQKNEDSDKNAESLNTSDDMRSQSIDNGFANTDLNNISMNAKDSIMRESIVEASQEKKKTVSFVPLL